jgi:hypothetical protein
MLYIYIYIYIKSTHLTKYTGCEKNIIALKRYYYGL